MRDAASRCRDGSYMIDWCCDRFTPENVNAESKTAIYAFVRELVSVPTYRLRTFSKERLAEIAVAVGREA